MIRVLSFAAVLLLAFGAEAQELVRYDGEAIQGGIIRGYTDPGASVDYEGTTLPVSNEGVFVFGFQRDFPEAATVTVTLPSGETEATTFDVARREYALQIVEGIPPQYVSPPEEVLARIRAEQAVKREARTPVSSHTGFAEDFIWPLTGIITGTYGSARVYNETQGRPHLGIDVAQPTGTPIVAPASGVVTLADNDMYYEGGLIFLDHGHGMIDVFMHLSEVTVEVGQVVQQGEVIGLVGAGGRATGPHLDWRMYVMGQRVDPSNLVGPMPADDGVGGND